MHQVQYASINMYPDAYCVHTHVDICMNMYVHVHAYAHACVCACEGFCGGPVTPLLTAPPFGGDERHKGNACTLVVYDIYTCC